MAGFFLICACNGKARMYHSFSSGLVASLRVVHLKRLKFIASHVDPLATGVIFKDDIVTYMPSLDGTTSNLPI